MTRLDGADLSHYNTITDWSALRAATWWCATKATQGTTATDPTFAGLGGPSSEVSSSFSDSAALPTLSAPVRRDVRIVHRMAMSAHAGSCGHGSKAKTSSNILKASHRLKMCRVYATGNPAQMIQM